MTSHRYHITPAAALKKNWPFLLLLPALAVKLFIWSHAAPDFNGRPMTYVQPAEEILHGTYSGTETFRRTPGYPVFLAGLFAAAGKAPAKVTLAQHFLGLGTAALAMKTAALVCSSPYAAAAAGALLAFNPALTYYEGLAESETLAVFLLALALYLLIRALKAPAPADRWWLAAGLAGCAAALTRPETAVIGLAPLPFLFVPGGWRQAGIFLAAFFVPLALWMLRNLVMFGALTLSPMGMITSVQTSWPLVDWSAPAHAELKGLYREVLSERGGNHSGVINEAIARLGRSRSFDGAVREGYALGSETLRAHPLRYIVLTGKNFTDYLATLGFMLPLAAAGFTAAFFLFPGREAPLFALCFVLLLSGNCFVELSNPRRSIIALPPLALLAAFLAPAFGRLAAALRKK